MITTIAKSVFIKIADFPPNISGAAIFDNIFQWLLPNLF